MTPEQFHAEIWETLGPVDDADFEALVAGPPGEADIIAVSAALGAPIPPEFVAFSRRSNGMSVVARKEVWPEPEQYSVGEAWMFWRGVVLLGFDAEDLPEWASIAAAGRDLAQWGVEHVAPIFTVLGDSSRVWGVDETGASVLVMDGEVQRLDAPITVLYAEQIAELVARQQDMAKRTRA